MSKINAAVNLLQGEHTGASGSWGVSSIRSKTLRAEANAFCSSVTTDEISLKGFVYWFA